MTTLNIQKSTFSSNHIILVSKNISIGDIVKIIGLKNKTCYNHHIGRVKYIVQGGEINAKDRCCTLALIQLHKTIWPEADRLAGIDDEDDEQDDEEVHNMSDIISVKLSNIYNLYIDDIQHKYRMRYHTVSKNTIEILLRKSFRIPKDVANYISEFLQVKPVTDVEVVGCSSTSGQYPLEAVLDNSTKSWWISSSQSSQRRFGGEYLEFSFGLVTCQLNYIGIRIPPLPSGPLSVREFHLLALSELIDPDSKDVGDDSNWILYSPIPFITLDRAGLQEFHVYPPLDAKRIRLVCTKNAASDHGGEIVYNSIGLFSVFFA